jgi:AraC-like DNA-binding protein
LNLFHYEPITQLIDVAYREHYQPLEMLSHHHNDYEVIYVAEGRIKFTIGDKTYIAEKNNLLFINNVESHEYKVLDYPYKRYVIMMKPHFIHSTVNDSLLTSILYHRPEHYSHLISLETGTEEPLRSIIFQMLKEFREKKPLYETSLKFLFYQLLIRLYRISKDYFPFSKYENSDDHRYKTVLEVQKYIESNCTRDLNLTELSEQFHIDMYYLCHLFKEITGYTIKSYILLQRISIAKELLYHTNDSITNVGFNAGFNNVSHFIRTFKKHIGTTPYQYRKDYRDTTLS